jgi:hypothetical protein
MIAFAGTVLAAVAFILRPVVRWHWPSRRVLRQLNEARAADILRLRGENGRLRAERDEACEQRDDAYAVLGVQTVSVPPVSPRAAMDAERDWWESWPVLDSEPNR